MPTNRIRLEREIDQVKALMTDTQWGLILKKLSEALEHSRDRLENLHPDGTVNIALEQRDIRTYRWFMRLPGEIANDLQSELDAE